MKVKDIFGVINSSHTVLVQDLVEENGYNYSQVTTIKTEMYGEPHDPSVLEKYKDREVFTLFPSQDGKLVIYLQREEEEFDNQETPKKIKIKIKEDLFE